VKIRHLCVTLMLLLSARSAFAWGANGHRVVGRVAEHHLSPAAARGVACILGGESLAQAATWPDEIRSDPSWSRATPWHFVSVDDGESYDPAKSPEGDVVQAIDRFSKLLRDPQADRTAKTEALRFLVHFVGDIHQPLHVGRRADRGGNTIRVNWFGENTNLHSVWDEKILEAEKLSFSELAEFVDHPTDGEIKVWQSAAVLDWMKESADLRARVYDIGDGKLGYAYQYQNIPLVKRRLLQAGVRLAGLLNAIFADAGPSIPDRPPAANPPH
jgi:heat shock protein HspQ